mmetsp:Transcript_34527/g.86786  ORF Transcript_34527/g.86786 Transcript_34527/m.86786 type:complete len:226 (-) Transcript_34527:558-1235(-)
MRARGSCTSISPVNAFVMQQRSVHTHAQRRAQSTLPLLNTPSKTAKSAHREGGGDAGDPFAMTRKAGRNPGDLWSLSAMPYLLSHTCARPHLGHPHIHRELHLVTQRSDSGGGGATRRGALGRLSAQRHRSVLRAPQRRPGVRSRAAPPHCPAASSRTGSFRARHSRVAIRPASAASPTRARASPRRRCCCSAATAIWRTPACRDSARVRSAGTPGWRGAVQIGR